MKAQFLSAKIEKLESHIGMFYDNYIFCWLCNLDLTDHNELNFPKKDHNGYPRKKKTPGDEMQSSSKLASKFCVIHTSINVE